MAEKTNLSAPWIEHVHKIEQLFLSDEDVRVKYDDGAKLVKLFVKGTDKACALDAIIARELEFDGVTLRVVVIPDNSEPTLDEILHYAFTGNELFEGTATEEVHGDVMTYALFRPEVVQFWNDNIGSCYGVTTIAAEDVARSVLNVDAFICSDLKAE